MKKHVIFLFMLLLLCPFTLAADDNNGSDLIFKWDIRFWGADAGLGYRGVSFFDGVDTIFWVSAGGGYQSANYFPNSDDTTVPSDSALPGYDNLNIDWRLGISQGILYNEAQQRNLLDFTLLYRGKYQSYYGNDYIPAGYPDRNGLWQNSIMAGFVFDTVYYDSEMVTREGIYSSISAEFAPRLFLNEVVGNTGFTRLNVLAIVYKPLLSDWSFNMHIFDRLVFDYLFGNDAEIPISARTTMGGLSNVPILSNPGSYRGLGGAVRGIRNDRFDGFMKIVNNLELRMYFPVLNISNMVTPGLVIYFDSGVYDKLTRTLQFDPIYLSTGAGLVLHALSYDVVGYLNYFINENNFTFSFSLGAHF